MNHKVNDEWLINPAGLPLLKCKYAEDIDRPFNKGYFYDPKTVGNKNWKQIRWWNIKMSSLKRIQWIN